MKKLFILPLFGLMLAASGCLEQTGYKTFDYPTEFKFKPTEIREGMGEVDLIENCEYSYHGSSLPYVDQNHWNSFYCLEKCTKPGSYKSWCRSYGFKNFSPALDYLDGSCMWIDDCPVDVNIIYECMELDGNLVYAPVEFQRCRDECNVSATACN